MPLQLLTRGRFPVHWIACAAAVLLTGFAARPAHAVTVPTGFVDDAVAFGMDFPVGMASLPDGRVVVVEQFSGNIILVRPGPPAVTNQLMVVDSMTASGNGERGLLGIAVDPQWPSRPYIYAHFTRLGSKVRIARYKATGALSDPTGLIAISPASLYVVVDDIPDAQYYHNGGTVRFGPDGMLYVTNGEDGNMPAAQDTTSMRGVVLRIDVTRLPDGPGRASRDLVTPPDNPFANNVGPGGRLIWAYGLRNPFRLTIDSQNGRVAIADVGQNTWEELNVATQGGMNFGWPRFEGTSVFNSGASLTGTATPPAYQMNHTEGVTSIIPGVFYRRPAGATAGFPSEYNGNLFVTDYSGGMLRRLVESGGTWAIAPPVDGQPNATDWGAGFDGVTDFFVGKDGALWLCRHISGEVRRIRGPVSLSTPEPDGSVAFAPPSPTPSSGSVSFSGWLPADGPLRLALYDVRGRLVKELVRESDATAGHFRITWDGADAHGGRVPAGIYFARLHAGSVQIERRVLIIR